ncbi:MAG: hypothetical protein GXO48_01565 [Chlorobi bacterium]|nr:hypothetical protein [Chlorobiota bacterium]
MKRLKTLGIAISNLLFPFVFWACTQDLHYVEGRLIVVDSSIEENEEIARWLKPYKDSINSALNDTITILNAGYCKDDSLGMLIIRQFEQAIFMINRDTPSLIVQNKGGIRKTCLDAGPLLLRDIYQIMPFDNIVAEQCLPQQTFDSLLKTIRTRGWYFKVYSTQCEPCCRVILSDYLASGGDDLSFLRKFKFSTTQNLLLRDAFRKGFEIPDEP